MSLFVKRISVFLNKAISKPQVIDFVLVETDKRMVFSYFFLQKSTKPREINCSHFTNIDIFANNNL